MSASLMWIPMSHMPSFLLLKLFVWGDLRKQKNFKHRSTINKTSTMGGFHNFQQLIQLTFQRRLQGTDFILDS